jgi:hypothetical protein
MHWDKAPTYDLTKHPYRMQWLVKLNNRLISFTFANDDLWPTVWLPWAESLCELEQRGYMKKKLKDLVQALQVLLFCDLPCKVGLHYWSGWYYNRDTGHIQSHCSRINCDKIRERLANQLESKR